MNPTVAGCALALCSISASAAIGSVDLATYVRVGRYDLPEPTRTAAPTGNLLAQEASAVTYNRDTGTLFIVGDGGRAITQVTTTGTLIDTMTLAEGGSPQGTFFYDPEGLTYVGGGRFAMVEERERRVHLVSYAAGTTLGASPSGSFVKLGTTIGNNGIEGIAYDPTADIADGLGFVAVKESGPQGVFETRIDFGAGTATNGSPSLANAVNLFEPTLAGLADFADVFALSAIGSLAAGPDGGHLLILSQESGRIVEIDRAGNVHSSLTIALEDGDALTQPISIADMNHEGLTMDERGFLYVVSENGGGDADHPQLWVYAPSPVPLPAAGWLLMSGLFALARRIH